MLLPLSCHGFTVGYSKKNVVLLSFSWTVSVSSVANQPVSHDSYCDRDLLIWLWELTSDQLTCKIWTDSPLKLSNLPKNTLKPCICQARLAHLNVATFSRWEPICSVPCIQTLSSFVMGRFIWAVLLLQRDKGNAEACVDPLKRTTSPQPLICG